MNKHRWVILAFLLTFLSGSLFACNSNTGAPTSKPTTTGAQRLYLTSGNISVNATTTNDYAFNVTAKMKNPAVVGVFQTFGGAPNQIEVYIMDDATYLEFQKGSKDHILFDSGAKSNGNINQAITVPGKYHLLFTNYSAASVSPVQKLTAIIYLKWDN